MTEHRCHYATRSGSASGGSLDYVLLVESWNISGFFPLLSPVSSKWFCLYELQSGVDLYSDTDFGRPSRRLELSPARLCHSHYELLLRRADYLFGWRGNRLVDCRLSILYALQGTTATAAQARIFPLAHQPERQRGNSRSVPTIEPVRV